jgi:hypothetical protein
MIAWIRLQARVIGIETSIRSWQGARSLRLGHRVSACVQLEARRWSDFSPNFRLFLKLLRKSINSIALITKIDYCVLVD